ncbi:glycosyltransferase family 2 protein [Nonomuraea soli]
MLPLMHANLLGQGVELEWIIVDDGSVDETSDLVSWLAWQSAFGVRYLRQPHEGRHVAINRGVDVARGELIALLDAGDLVAEGALERLLGHWPGGPRYAGVLGSSTGGGAAAPRPFPAAAATRPFPVAEATWHELTYRHRWTEPTWGLVRTDLMRAHPYPRVRGYVPDSVVWRRITHPYLLVDEPVLLSRPAEHTPFAELATGLARSHGLALTHDLRWLRRRPLWFLRSAVHLRRAVLHLGKESMPALPRTGRALVGLSRPLAWALYRRDRKR